MKRLNKRQALRVKKPAPESVSDTLRMARDWIIEMGWTTGYLAQVTDKRGNKKALMTSYLDPVGAMQWRQIVREIAKQDKGGYCAIGGLRMVDGPEEKRATQILAWVAAAQYKWDEGRFLEAFSAETIGTRDHTRNQEAVYDFNDNNTEDEVIEAFDAAIVVALQEEGKEPEDYCGKWC